MKAYLIPGFRQGAETPDYDSVLKIYKDQNYDAEFVPINWRYTTIDDWVDQALEHIQKKELADSLLSGFSYGAMVAFTIAAKVANPHKLLLFSLSAQFAEDLPKYKRSELQQKGRKHRLEAFSRVHFDELVGRISCMTLIFIGEEEKDPIVRQRSKNAHMQISGSELIMVPEAPHDIGHPRYVKAIKKALK